MYRSINLVVVALSLVGLLAATSAQANCTWDAVGNSDLTPPYSFAPDGRITLGDQYWWNDDVMACYNAFLTPAYLYYFPGCDHDGSGAVEVSELFDVYNFLVDNNHLNPLYGLPGEPAYAYTCPTYECSDIPDFYNPSASDVEWAASGVCAELKAAQGALACTEDEYSSVLADMNYIMTNYPFTGAVFDGIASGGQSFNPSPYILFCGTGGEGTITEDTFSDLNSCYHGQDKFLFNGAMDQIEFDWGVNAAQLTGEYLAVVQAAYGPDAWCETDGMVGGGPLGFHATDAGYGYTAYTVEANANCDYDGCRCNATLTILSDGAGSYVVDSIVNNSILSMCEDQRFNF